MWTSWSPAPGTRQLGEAVEDLLPAARLRRACGSFGPVGLTALAEAARARERDVKIEVRRQDACDHIVRGAQPALRRVISALLDDALGHTGAGGRRAAEVSGPYRPGRRSGR
ncbi:hypothetical protein ACFFMN_05770 [Planobispora siamensis]|uniref:Uncharacterized protein n=1 Tax=Planobispora siamensis TaxID=936338 RepID=A0A8J3WKM3_9ACTN|nr:hypothetical protein [Planobispora siamensis]GIH94309.1 hypothetical protein Psi01_49390 [Planobispora siamensis]